MFIAFLFFILYAAVVAAWRTIHILSRMNDRRLAFWVLVWLGACCVTLAMCVGSMLIRWFMGQELWPWK